MSEPARELPADSPDIPAAVAAAQRGEITHLTVDGERAAVIVPEFFLTGVRELAAGPRPRTPRTPPRLTPRGMSPARILPWEQVKAELGI